MSDTSLDAVYNRHGCKRRERRTTAQGHHRRAAGGEWIHTTCKVRPGLAGTGFVPMKKTGFVRTHQARTRGQDVEIRAGICCQNCCCRRNLVESDKRDRLKKE